MVANKIQTNSVPALRFKRTKIVASIGPATFSAQAIEDLVRAGTNSIRINFSHGTNEEHLKIIEWSRAAAKKLDRPVAIIQDLQGPKLRVGKLPDEGVMLKKGEKARLQFGISYKNRIIPTQHDFSNKLNKNEPIFLNDGRIKLVVEKVNKKLIETTVLQGGLLTSNKGINLPETDMKGEILTKKDLEDIRFGLNQDFDYVAVSFVQRASDMDDVRQYLKKNKSDAKLIAKIETKAALENIEEIVKASDGVMIARGDLAVEAGLEVVPVAQRKIIGLVRQYGKFAIVATQMLLSMLNSTQPSRADVSDVATAVIIGSDAVMLSDETTMGKYPIETVQTMKKIILYTEENSPLEPVYLNLEDSSTERAMASAAITLAHQLKAKLIVAETLSGRNARTIAAQRPQMPIAMPTTNERVANQLAIIYASKPIYHPHSDGLSDLAIKVFRESLSISKGDYIVLTYGKQAGKIAGANTLRILHIE
jgi:pyruvate kinase